MESHNRTCRERTIIEQKEKLKNDLVTTNLPP